MRKKYKDDDFVERDQITGRAIKRRINKKKLTSEELDEIFLDE